MISWIPYNNQTIELKKNIEFVVIDKSLALLVLNILIIWGIFAKPVVTPNIVARIGNAFIFNFRFLSL